MALGGWIDGDMDEHGSADHLFSLNGISAVIKKQTRHGNAAECDVKMVGGAESRDRRAGIQSAVRARRLMPCTE